MSDIFLNETLYISVHVCNYVCLIWPESVKINVNKCLSLCEYKMYYVFMHVGVLKSSQPNQESND